MTRQLPRWRRRQHWVDGRRTVDFELRDAAVVVSPRIQQPKPLRSYRVSRRFDGMISADGAGRRYRVFAPAWWQVWRWVAFLRASVRGSLNVIVDGKFYRVRALGIPASPVRPRRA